MSLSDGNSARTSKKEDLLSCLQQAWQGGKIRHNLPLNATILLQYQPLYLMKPAHFNCSSCRILQLYGKVQAHFTSKLSFFSTSRRRCEYSDLEPRAKISVNNK